MATYHQTDDRGLTQDEQPMLLPPEPVDVGSQVPGAEAKRFVEIVADEAGEDLLVSTTALFDSFAQNEAMIAHARSGDKGNHANIGVIADSNNARSLSSLLSNAFDLQ